MATHERPNAGGCAVLERICRGSRRGPHTSAHGRRTGTMLARTGARVNAGLDSVWPRLAANASIWGTRASGAEARGGGMRGGGARTRGKAEVRGRGEVHGRAMRRRNGRERGMTRRSDARRPVAAGCRSVCRSVVGWATPAEARRSGVAHPERCGSPQAAGKHAAERDIPGNAAKSYPGIAQKGDRRQDRFVAGVAGLAAVSFLVRWGYE